MARAWLPETGTRGWGARPSPPWLPRLMLAACFSLPFAGPLWAQPTSITILHIGDTRSHLAAGGAKDASLAGTMGGLARAATLVRLLREMDETSILVHAGDLASGDLAWNAFRGVPELQVLRALGLDAMGVGERELAAGPAPLGELLSSMNQGSEPFKMLSANLDTSACGEDPCGPLRQWVEPSRILEVAGVRIGVFALTAPDDPLRPPGPVVVLGEARAALRARAYETAAELRADGAQLVILLSHLDRDSERELAATQPSPLVDLVVEGHGDALHEPLPIPGPEGHTTLIVAAGGRYEHVGRLRLTVDGPQVAVDEYALFTAGPWIEPDPAVATLVSALEQRIVAGRGEDVYGAVVGRALRDIEPRADAASPACDSPLGNLVGDALRWKAHAEIGLTANGYLGDKLYRGAIVGADLFRAVGHERSSDGGSSLLRIEVTGAELARAIERTLGDLERNDSLSLQVSGLRYRYDSRRPPRRRLAADSLRVHGEPVDPDRVYSVAIGTALAEVLVRVFGVEVESAVPLQATEYEALRDYVLRAKLLRARSEGRIQDVARRPRARP
jgi:2',3'-cyclic-nucleotide 2'-phosphodiesterase (5'-nucleotidase family)